MNATTTKQTTTRGTPTSPQWDDEWIAEVENVEGQLGRRICGAHSPAWTPCKLGSTHKNGRCRYHGGRPGIGAPLGNRNAIIHGLYSRRLQQCGEHCALWQTCPMPNKDISALPHKERPHCVYEKEEYDALTFAFEKEKDGQAKAINDKWKKERDAFFEKKRNETIAGQSSRTPSFGKSAGEQSAPADGPSGDAQKHEELPAESGAALSQAAANPSQEDLPASQAQLKNQAGEMLLYHNIATLQIMLTRAKAALGWHQFTEETRAEGDHYAMKSTKVSALLEAQLRIARELRQWLRILAGDSSQINWAWATQVPDYADRRN